jgi:hypothetical protein
LGSERLTYEDRQLVRRERHKVVVAKYRRELRMTDIARPETDFDTEERGLALLDFAKNYRQTKPKAPLSEIADEFLKMEQIIMRTHQHDNGKV